MPLDSHGGHATAAPNDCARHDQLQLDAPTEQGRGLGEGPSDSRFRLVAVFNSLMGGRRRSSPKKGQSCLTAVQIVAAKQGSRHSQDGGDAAKTSLFVHELPLVMPKLSWYC